MKKIVLKMHPNICFYNLEREHVVNFSELYYVHLALNPFDDSWIQCDIDKENNEVFIYSLNSIKDQAKLEFETEEEQNLFDNQYEAYYDKRWDEMPQVTMSLTNWEELQVKWEKIKNEKPEYVVFMLDDSRALDKVDVYGKNELTEEDKAYIKQEHEKFLKYERAHQKYIDNHPDYSYVWRGPQDDEYEADVMKYYEE